MIIKISNLSDGSYNYKFEGEVAEIGLSKSYTGSYETNIELSKFQHQIILKSETQIKADMVCDRCSEMYDQVIKSEYKMVYLLRGTEEENESMDIVYLNADTDKINIKDDVRDYASLALPMKKLCTEDCKGLCYRCGKNLNKGACECNKNEIDIRWKPLMKLKNNR
ncbi:MAG: DUF177 domain-containing protein [Ignavibacteriaceae bacterium]|jgi:uncharacterized protein